jgi:hypothetical protein
MRKLSLSSSLTSLLEELEYTEAALSANPDTKDLAVQFQERIEEWDDIFKRERVARRGVVRTDAVLAIRDAMLDATTTRFGGAVLVEAGQDRKSPFFRKYFPKAPSAVIGQALRKQCDHTLNTMVPELAKLEATSPLNRFRSELEQEAKSALTALDARNQARAFRATEATEVEEWKDGVNRLRLSTYGALLDIAARKGFHRVWADDFFRSGRARPGDEDPEPTVPSVAGVETPPSA